MPHWWLSLCFTFSLFSVPAWAQLSDIRVVWIVIDGVRQQELKGLALDDSGKKISAASLFPEITALKKHGVYFSNVEISNPAGVSLPAYADMFAGRRQEDISNNDPPVSDRVSHHPTIFEAVMKEGGLDANGIYVSASWRKICPLTIQKGGPLFERSCGWEKGKFLKGEVYEDSRSDADTFVEVLREFPRREPKLTFIHFGNADEEAHLQKAVKRKSKANYGIFAYHQALRESDYYIGRLWEMVEAIPSYKGKTYFFITTDHGRDDAGEGSWSDHGNCMACDGYKKVFALVAGPGLKLSGREVQTAYTHADFAPTLAQLFGIGFPTSTGRPMSELWAPSPPQAERKIASEKKP